MNINIILHLNISVFPMILLASIFLSMRVNAIQTNDRRQFRILLEGTFLLLLLELFSWIADGLEYPFAYQVAWLTNLIFFALIPAVSLLWLNYLNYHVNGKNIHLMKNGRKMLLLVPMMVYGVILVLTPWTGWIFTIGEQNRYVRGTFYFLPYVLCIFYMLFSIYSVLRSALSEKLIQLRRQYLPLCFFTIIPIFAGVIQGFLDGVWLVFPCTALSELLVYIRLQGQQIRTDTLTGINNRGCFDSYLEKQLLQTEKRIPICLFMIDLDHFKQINDTYGHDAGDEALIRTVSLLTDFCRGTDAFLARYGGDEFCIVRGCNGKDAAEGIANGLHEVFERFNRTGECRYRLSVSIGYCCSCDKENMTAERMVREADAMMYAYKNRTGRDAR